MKSIKTYFTGVSLFSSGGIGDISLREIGVNVIVANELIPERAELFRYNFPNTKIITGNIWDKQDDIIYYTKEILRKKN